MGERALHGAVTRCREGTMATVLAAGALALLVAGCAAPPPKVVEVVRDVPNCELPDLTTTGKYVVEAWGIPDNRFAVGEPLTMQLRTAAPAYVTMFHVSSSCKITRLLDNEPMPMAAIIDFPARDSGMSITVKPPGGQEGFYIIATIEELSFLSDGDILSQSGDVAAIDMSPRQFYGRVEQARARMNPASWGLKTLRTEVVEH